MSVPLQLRRDTAANIATRAGAAGEIVIDTTNQRVTVHDGSTLGGFAAPKIADLTSSKLALAATSLTQVGTDPTRSASIDTSGRLSITYGDNSAPTFFTCSNVALSGANQGATPAAVKLGGGTSGTALALSGYLTLLSTGDYSTTAARNSAWSNYAEVGGSITNCFIFDGVGGNKSSFNLLPTTDNARTLGSSALRFSTVFAGTSTINTSDAREKTSVAPLDDRELAAATALGREIGSYRFLAAVAEKGDAARLQAGLTVQRAMEVMTAAGLDPMRYAFICHDKWDAVPNIPAVPARDAVVGDVIGEDGKPTGETQEIEPATREVPAVPGHAAGDRYGFRVEELLLFLARGFDARLAALESAGSTKDRP